MTMLHLDLPPQLYERLQAEATRLGKPIEVLAREWLATHVALGPDEAQTDRDRARAVLRQAGLLTELGPEGKARAARSTATLDEVRAALDRAGGKPLSEVILDMRGTKE